MQARALLVALVTLLTAGPSGAATIAVSIDPNADRHAVSPQIFGMNFGDAAQMSRLKVPVRRWGGNSVTRYNWETDTHNSASDWFFINYANGVPDPAALPDGSSADTFVDEIRAAGGEALITVPLIGWTPIDRTRRWGFSVAKYGAQQQTECSATGYPSWCNPDAGNGVRPDSSYVTGNDPADTSKPIGPDFVTRWMAHIAGRVGTAEAGGVRLWALDNEPFLWNSTHHDVHQAGVSYDELWAKTTLIAPAIKTQDPNAKILGPADWGWCAYFFSAADGCSPGPDRAAHGGMDFIPWYLQQANAWETGHGVRILDYLDVHYYPQANGVALTNDESVGTSALRLRTLKSLYDPTYIDESWIGTDLGQAVYLIPRMKAWIAANYPGTKLAISEYNWGSDDGISGALAQAEALAIFGREGVDLATRWVAPVDNTKTEDAFLLYRNYDGAGAQVKGDSVRATSANVDAVGAYAIRGGAGGNTLYILLFNKDTAAQTAAVSVACGLTQAAQLFRFADGLRLAAAGTATPAAGSLTLALPARSATLAVVALPTTAATASNTGPYCAGATIALSTPTVSGATYAWTGPNGFTSTQQSPTISSATAANAGTYSVTVTVAGCTSSPGTTSVTVDPTPTPHVTAPASSLPGTTGLIASVLLHAGSSYLWGITNGTITAGAGTNQITFTAGPSGVTILTVVETTNATSCASSTATANVYINAEPAGLVEDAHATGATISNVNKVLEPGETVLVNPSWKNITASPLTLTGTASAFTGPAGAIYSLLDSSAGYGTIPPGATADSFTAGGPSYRLSVSNPGVRPAAHWDATFLETLSDGVTKTWTLHVGQSFSDVPVSDVSYPFVENIFHNGISAGCGGGNYCPASNVNRWQMAVLLATGMAGSGAAVPSSGTVPSVGSYNCTSGGNSLFGDVPPTDPGCRFIHYIYAHGLTTGCGGGNYCPASNVNRWQMAVLLATGMAGSGAAVPSSGTVPSVGSYNCTLGGNSLFGDVPPTDPGCRFIHYIYANGVTAGCGGGNYCPASNVNRWQMAVFLVTAFKIPLLY
jgi:hypothetical protein